MVQQHVFIVFPFFATAKGMSYWLDRAEEEGITYMGLLEEYAKVQPTCEIQISAIQETEDFAQVTVENCEWRAL